MVRPTFSSANIQSSKRRQGILSLRVPTVPSRTVFKAARDERRLLCSSRKTKGACSSVRQLSPSIPYLNRFKRRLPKPPFSSPGRKALSRLAQSSAVSLIASRKLLKECRAPASDGRTLPSFNVFNLIGEDDETRCEVVNLDDKLAACARTSEALSLKRGVGSAADQIMIEVGQDGVNSDKTIAGQGSGEVNNKQTEGAGIVIDVVTLDDGEPDECPSQHASSSLEIAASAGTSSSAGTASDTCRSLQTASYERNGEDDVVVIGETRVSSSQRLPIHNVSGFRISVTDLIAGASGSLPAQIIQPPRMPLCFPSYFVREYARGCFIRTNTAIFDSNMPKKFTDVLSEATAKICRQIIRRWEIVQNVNSIIESQMHCILRVCSYNVLCQETISKTMYLYRHITSERLSELEWENRKELLERDLRMIDADIVCLQEVQQDHYTSFYLPLLSSEYIGLYKKRTRENVDGCAIFFKRKFRVVCQKDVEYFKSEGCVLDRDNVALLVRLQDKRTKLEVCVANTHLLFNMKRGDVKLAQLAVLLATLDQECGPSSQRPCAHILCGDFNMHPHSGLYEFMVRAFLSFANIRRDWLARRPLWPCGFGLPDLTPEFLNGTVNVDKDCKFFEKVPKCGASLPRNYWTHPFRLTSVYSHFAADGSDEVSSYNSQEKGLSPDFIFYSIDNKTHEGPFIGQETGRVSVFEGRLKLRRRLTLPSEQMLKDTLGPWPNASTPSDHIPLVADFVLL